MLKKIIFILYIISITKICFADIPIIKAEIGHIVDFSEESQKVFNIIYAENFEEKNKITEKEKTKLKDKKFRETYIEDSKNSEFYDGEKLNIWQVLGDLEKNLDFYPYPYKIKVSSYLKAENGINYSPLNINDNSFKTAWIGGNNNNGKNEWIECYMSKKYDGDADISRIYIFNGYVKSNKSFIENSRVKNLKIYTDSFDYEFDIMFYDHFGLDPSDVTPNGAQGTIKRIAIEGVAGFSSWYVLQHLKEFQGSYTPMIVKMPFTYSKEELEKL